MEAIVKKEQEYFMIRMTKVDYRLGARYIIIDDMPNTMSAKMSFINMVRASREKADNTGGYFISFCSVKHPRRKEMRKKFAIAKHLTIKETLEYNLDDLWKE